MSPILIVVMTGIVFIVILMVIFFSMPSEEKKHKRKKILPPEESKVPKDWEVIVARHDKQMSSSRQEIAAWEKKYTVLEKQLMLEQAKFEKLQEKINQERGWHEKEQSEIERKNKDLKNVMDDLKEIQESFSKEHSENLKLGRECTELKKQIDLIQEQRRLAESEAAQLKAKVESQFNDIRQFKKENAELTKKKEDTTWIAKADYDRIEKNLKEKEKEIERLNRDIRKEMS